MQLSALFLSLLPVALAGVCPPVCRPEENVSFALISSSTFSALNNLQPTTTNSNVGLLQPPPSQYLLPFIKNGELLIYHPSDSSRFLKGYLTKRYGPDASGWMLVFEEQVVDGAITGPWGVKCEGARQIVSLQGNEKWQACKVPDGSYSVSHSRQFYSR